jgi:hypothetical protein
MIDRRELLLSLTVAAIATRLPGGGLVGRQGGNMWAAVQLADKIADVGEILPTLVWCEVAQAIVMDRATVTAVKQQACGAWWHELSCAVGGEKVPPEMLAASAAEHKLRFDPVTRVLNLT